MSKGLPLPVTQSVPKSKEGGILLAPRRQKKSKDKEITSLHFQPESWTTRLERIFRKAFCSSLPDDSIERSTATSVTEQERPNWEEVLEAQKKEESTEWVTNLTIDENVTHAGSSEHERTEHSSQYNSRTKPSEVLDDPFGKRYFGHTVLGSINGAVRNFFAPKFADKDMEEVYQKEKWSNMKPLAMCAVAFMILNWVLYLIFNEAHSYYEKIAYYGVSTAVTLPIPFFVAFNLPREGHGELVYQIVLMIATWFWGVSECIETRVCHFYPSRRACQGKDFLFMMAYSIAMPALTGFGCNQRRLYMMLGATVQFVLLCVLVLPVQHIFVRNVVTYLCFQLFWVFLHYYLEAIDRRTYLLRHQLKIAYKAQQKAQIAQKAAANSKRRFVSYIFHEVRVPLNSAMLAFQNLLESNAFEACEKDQALEIDALQGSMSAVKQVLDDSLDLQKMDSGRFESNEQPFPFHRSVESMLGPLMVATTAKGLSLTVELDPAIDELGRKFQGREDGQCWVVGDVLRYRQILSNLSSNAVKFTSKGGVTVKTKLMETLMETLEPEEVTPVDEKHKLAHPSRPLFERGPSLRHNLPDLTDRNEYAEKVESRTRRIVIRTEVSDTGHGIRPSESEKLFSPFSQTRLGHYQAGRGSGLGLAIVRQIVTLSHGRLGVMSEKDKGSTFWFEIPFDLAEPEDMEKAAQGDSWRPQQPASELPNPRIPLLSFADAVNSRSSHSKVSTPAISPRSFVVEAPSESVTTTTSVSVPATSPTASTAPTTPSPLLQHASKQADPFNHNKEVKLDPLGALPSPQEERPLSILVVDDDGLTRKLLQRMLERLGCVVSTAEDGQEALDILLGSDQQGPQRFDMISLDNAMPRRSGPEVVSKLRQVGRDDFVVGATGNALKSDQTKYFEAGADQVLAKPILLKDLKDMLNMARERRQMQPPP